MRTPGKPGAVRAQQARLEDGVAPGGGGLCVVGLTGDEEFWGVVS